MYFILFDNVFFPPQHPLSIITYLTSILAWKHTTKAEEIVYTERDSLLTATSSWLTSFNNPTGSAAACLPAFGHSCPPVPCLFKSCKQMLRNAVLLCLRIMFHPNMAMQCHTHPRSLNRECLFILSWSTWAVASPANHNICHVAATTGASRLCTLS